MPPNSCTLTRGVRVLQESTKLYTIYIPYNFQMKRALPKIAYLTAPSCSCTPGGPSCNACPQVNGYSINGSTAVPVGNYYNIVCDYSNNINSNNTYSYTYSSECPVPTSPSSSGPS